jgi:4-amino-4-deoxy-L-arabinose transferase-like glycosyltransferase
VNKKFTIFLGSITLFRLIYAIILPLAPQEAYYWNYARHPALSYFDHPPMSAYLIKLTTLLGISSFSIHLAAILLSIPMTIAIYRLGSLLFDEWVGFWSAVAINITFIYAIGSLIITPDSPMLLFWALSMIACYRIDSGGSKSWWLLLGIFIGAGFVSKYTIAFAALGAIIFFLTSKERIRWFATPWPYLSAIIALIVASPVIYWNFSHNWVSFAFQTSKRAGEMTKFRPDFFFGYIGTIIGIYGIVPIPLLFAGIWSSAKEAFRSRTANHMLLISFSVPLVLFLFPVSARSWVKMNWTAPAFIGWFIAAVVFYKEFAFEKRWVRLLGKTSILFLAFMILIGYVAFGFANIILGSGDYFSGWSELGAKVSEIRKEMPSPYFITGAEYKIPSELAFYLPDHPETVGPQAIGKDGLQYSFWCNPDTLMGRNAIVIFYRNKNGTAYEDYLKSYFADISPAEKVEIERNGQAVKGFLIYRCYNYLGIKDIK